MLLSTAFWSDFWLGVGFGVFFRSFTTKGICFVLLLTAPTCWFWKPACVHQYGARRFLHRPVSLLPPLRDPQRDVNMALSTQLAQPSESQSTSWLVMGMLCKRVIHDSLFAEERRCNGWSFLHSPLLVTAYSNVFNNSPKPAQWLHWGLTMSMTSAENLPGAQTILSESHSRITVSAWHYSLEGLTVQRRQWPQRQEQRNGNVSRCVVWMYVTLISLFIRGFLICLFGDTVIKMMVLSSCAFSKPGEMEGGSDTNQRIYCHPLSACT